MNLRLRRLGISGMLEEQTVTENVSRGGAQVFTTLPVSSGETITVADLDDKVAAEALVRNVYVGPNRVTRLNLQFPDGPVSSACSTRPGPAAAGRVLTRPP